jgi:uncharacterized protein YfaS (alpha-2-macroglobulin family)
LLGYPHGCIEQVTSKAFPQLYLKDFASLSERQEREIETAVKSVINRYRSYMHYGGFSYWPGETTTSYWGTVYATHFMVEAEKKGYVVPASLKKTALTTLGKSSRDWKATSDKNYYPSDEMTQAYRLYVLALAQQPEIGAMNRLKENSSLNPVSRWMLASAYVLCGQQSIANNLIVRTTEQQVNYTAYDYTFGSQVRDWGICLQTLVLLNKGQEAATLVNTLSQKLSSSSWLNTQETAFSLIGLSAYMNSYQTSKQMRFSYSTGKNQAALIANTKSIWSETVLENYGSKANLEITNEGESTLFVRLIAEGIPSRGEEKAAANGLDIAIDYADDSGKKLDVTRLKQGEHFTAKVSITNKTFNPLQNLVVSQLFPAGWEILNTRFLPQEEGKENNTGTISYQDIRDDRIYTYIDHLKYGYMTWFSVKLTATYSGTYYLPPVYCEAMYDHSIQANTEGMTVVVE